MRGRLIRWLLPGTLVAVLGVGAAMAATTMGHSGSGTVQTAKNSKYGTVLVNAHCRTLYRFAVDKKGASACTGGCAKIWPALVVKGNVKPTAGAGVKASMLGTIKRSAGVRQVTYGGFALYTYSADSKSGDVKGEGFDSYGGKWYVVDTKGAMVKKAVSGGGKTGWG
jgi:predicted lipoprotein with Yx(FWY)xxD motif